MYNKLRYFKLFGLPDEITNEYSFAKLCTLGSRRSHATYSVWWRDIYLLKYSFSMVLIVVLPFVVLKYFSLRRASYLFR